jgi:hypothetical protein
MVPQLGLLHAFDDSPHCHRHLPTRRPDSRLKHELIFVFDTTFLDTLFYQLAEIGYV